VVAGDAARPLPDGSTHCAHATLAFGRDGMLYVAYHVSRLAGAGRVYLTSSRDGGASFGAAIPVDAAPPGGGDFEPALATGPSKGTVSVAFERYADDFETAAVLSVSSNDAGGTLSRPVQVSQPAENAVNGRAAVASDRGGNLYVAWVDASDVDFDDGSGNARLHVAVSRDRGWSFAAPTTVASVPSGCGPNDDCGNRYPTVAIAAGGDGVVDLAWSAAAYPDPARSFVARSRDAGRTWTQPQRLAVPAGDVDRDQLRPSLAVAPDGRVDLGWADQARDADDGLLDVYLAYSIDGARSFSRPVRLDAVPSNTQRTPFASTVAVAASDGAAHAAWQDARVDRPAGSTVLFARVPDAVPPRIPGVVLSRALDGVAATYRLSSTDAFTPTSALRFRCAFDGAPLRACPMRFTRMLSPGRHVLRVRALDRAGNRSPLRTVAVRVG
jgi:hypothetical protein